MTQTMTKEQILGKVMPDYTGEPTFTRSEVFQAMDDFANQQLSAERERSGKLVEALENAIKDPETGVTVVYLSVDVIKKILSEYKPI